MPDEQRAITDDMALSELTVGEFKVLLQSILANNALQPEYIAVPPIEPKAEVKRKSLDEFMNDLGGEK